MSNYINSDFKKKKKPIGELENLNRLEAAVDPF